MSSPRPAPRGDQAWFEKWKRTLEQALELYARLPLALRQFLRISPIDLEAFCELAVVTRIMRHAIRNHLVAWREAVRRLEQGAPLAEVIRDLFDEDTSLRVALLVLRSAARGESAYDDVDVIAIGDAIEQRQAECESIGLPQYIWVVEVERNGGVVVSVARRSASEHTGCGLVKVSIA